MTVAAVAAAAPAFGHIPGIGNGLAPSTSGPDLRSVTVTSAALGPRARYCFDARSDLTAAADAAPASFFNIQTYDGRRAMSPVDVGQDGNDGNCIVATFPAGTDIAQGTVGEVVPNAVRDLQQRPNDFASEPLVGSVSTGVAGRTTGPDLVSAAVNVDNSAQKFIVYTFDENLQGGAFPNSAFGFYNAAGGRVSGPAGDATIGANTATVNFGGNGDLSAATSRFVTDQGAVQDLPQSVNLVGGTLSTPSSPGAFGTASTTAELTGAAAIGNNEFLLTFSRDVIAGSGNPLGFFAINDDGTTPGAASSIGPGGPSNTVIATFPGEVNREATVKILVFAGSIREADNITFNVTSEAATVTPNANPGFTNGPDLLAVGVDAPTRRVMFKYDEAVQPTPPASAFRAIAADGTPVAAILGSTSVNGNLVTVTYPNTISTAVAFANQGNTVFDVTGRPNPHQSVSKDIQVGPAPPPPPPPSPPVRPAPPPPPVSTPKPRARVTVTIKRRGRTYSGKLRSSRKACIQGRRVILKRRGNPTRFGQKKSSRRGTYSIKRKRRLRGRVYVSVTARSSSAVNCLPGKSKTIRG